MRAFELRNQSPNAQAEDIEVDITFTGFLIVLGKTNPVRFVTLVETLTSQCDSDARRQLFSEAEKIILESQNPPQTHWR